MPKIITMPTTPFFASSTFVLTRAIAQSVSPFTGKTRTQEFDTASWSSSVVLPAMRRDSAAAWQSFLLNAKGPTNFFLFTDPDAKTPRGTYNADALQAEARINSGSQVSSVTLSFSGSTITAGTAIFDGLVAGDFFFVSGATNEANNGTHKIQTKSSDTVVITTSVLTTESSTASCSVKQNVKGAEALSLAATSSSATGTVKQGDYLAVYNGTSLTTNDPVQLVMAVEDATLTSNGGDDHYSVAIQPKLRADLTNSHLVGFSSPHNESRFRLQGNAVEWSANAANTYTGITFQVTEVI